MKKPPYGSGRVFKHPGSPFWYAGYFVGGAEIRKSTGLPYEPGSNLNERRALAVLAEHVARTRDAVGGQGRVRYEDLRELILRDYRTKGRRSLQSLEHSVLYNLDKFWLGRRVTDVTAITVDLYIDRRIEQGAAHATRNNELAALKRMFRLGVEKKLISPVLLPVIKITQPDNARQGFLDLSQFLSIAEQLPARLVPLCQWLYATSWRVGEGTALLWTDLDFAEGLASIDGGRTKNREGKAFPFAQVDLARDAIEGALAMRDPDCPFVFHRRGKRIGKFYKMWAKACKAAGLAGRYIHDMRRSATRNLILSGVSEQDAMRITGHRTTSTFRRYNIRGVDDLRRASARLNSFLMGRAIESGSNLYGKNPETASVIPGAKVVQVPDLNEILMVGRGRIERPTQGFSVLDIKTTEAKPFANIGILPRKDST
jgi:integrase